MSIHQIIYISEASCKMSTAELHKILQKSQENNKAIDVTGSLFYNGGWFLQVLEGPRKTILELYYRIKKDTRHKNSRIIYNERASFRTFSRWTMNMTNLDNKQADKYEELIEVIEAAKTDRQIGSIPPAVVLLKLFKE